MRRSIKITLYLLGLLTLLATMVAFIQGRLDTATWFGLFCALALIGTAAFTRNIRD
jgi:hypothetical protein